MAENLGPATSEFVLVNSHPGYHGSRSFKAKPFGFCAALSALRLRAAGVWDEGEEPTVEELLAALEGEV